jgi:uncharacterized membrane protein
MGYNLQHPRAKQTKKNISQPSQEFQIQYLLIAGVVAALVVAVVLFVFLRKK